MAALSSYDPKRMTSLRDAIRVLAATLVLAAVVGCSHSSDADESAERSAAETAETATEADRRVASGELTVVDGRLERATWALQNRIYGLPGQPSAERMRGLVHAPFTGTLSPVGAPSAAGPHLIAYNSFADERPVLRVRNVVSDHERIVDVDTYSFAWRRDGALAYFKNLNPRVEDPMGHRGHVVVRASPIAKLVRWTNRPGRYVVSAWAGDRLLVHSQSGARWPDLVALVGPNRVRVVARRAALVALSPDGLRAFVTKEPKDVPVVSVVEVRTGRELATHSLDGVGDPIGGDPINYVSDSGAWAGETVIAAVTRGVAVFRITDNEIDLEQLLGVDPEVFPLGLSEPKLDETGQYFVAGAELEKKPRAAFSRTGLMECDRLERQCVLGRSGPSFRPPRPVYNPSRP